MKNTRGITLTELLVASVLVGIIMLGIVSVDYATRQSQTKATAVSQLAMETGAMMLDIMKAASLAVGDASSLANSGIFVNGNTACFRHDLPQTPSDYTDDSWICYTENANQLRKCTRTTVGNCPAPPASTVMGSVTTGGFAPQLTNDGQNLYFKVTLTNRTNPAAPKDPLTNPEYTIRSNRSPLAQGGPISQL